MNNQIHKEIYDFVKLPDIKEQLTTLFSISEKSNAIYKDWIGINFNNDYIESIKFYFSFYDRNSISDILKANILSSTLAESVLHQSKYIDSQYAENHLAFGSGITLALKYNREKKITKGVYFRVKEKALFPFEQTLGMHNLNKFSFEDSKGIFMLENENTDVHIKYYYYSNDKNLKLYFSEYFDYPDIFINTINLELSIGKGNILNNSDNDIKVILLDNETQTVNTFISKHCFDWIKNEIIEFQTTSKTTLFCPAFYLNKKIQSCYFFNLNELKESNHIKTIKTFLSE